MTAISNFIAKAPLLALGLLPRESTFATVHFCSEADDMPEYDEAVQVFSNVPARLVLVPVPLIQDVMMSIAADDFKSFDAYHAWYVKHNSTPRYGTDNRWPCIASDFPDEVVQDGWHRLHSYIRAGHDTIPILKYDFEAWWRAHRQWKEQTERCSPQYQ